MIAISSPQTDCTLRSVPLGIVSHNVVDALKYYYLKGNGNDFIL